MCFLIGDRVIFNKYNVPGTVTDVQESDNGQLHYQVEMTLKPEVKCTIDMIHVSELSPVLDQENDLLNILDLYVSEEHNQLFPAFRYREWRNTFPAFT